MPHTASAIDLPDANVWLALAAPTHVHHAPARAYWMGAASPQLVFTRISMLGLTRLVTNLRAMSGSPLSKNQAWEIYQCFKRLPKVSLLDEDQTLRTRWITSSNVGMQPGYSTQRIGPTRRLRRPQCPMARASCRLTTISAGLRHLTSFI